MKLLKYKEFLDEASRKDSLSAMAKHHSTQAKHHSLGVDVPGIKRISRRGVKHHELQLKRIKEIKRRISKNLDNRELLKQAEEAIKRSKSNLEIERSLVSMDNTRSKKAAARISKKARKSRV